MFKVFRSITVLTLVAILAGCSAYSIAEPLDSSSRKEVVDQIASMIEEQYVEPDQGIKTSQFIKLQLVSGKYSALDDRLQFAEELTKDLQSISKDKHMRVIVDSHQAISEQPKTPESIKLKRERVELEKNHGFKETRILPDNIGYIDFRFFSGNPNARDTAAAALKMIENSDAVIFDVRKNGGGNPEMVQFICSFFFKEKTHLNSLYWREGNRTEEFWTLEDIPGKQRPDVPVFIVTSENTFSGAEEFSYNFQTQNRGTIVGETTGGGANPGGLFRLDEGLAIFIPTGKAINPITGTNWEGTGVKPDFLTTADEALNKALALAQEAAKQFKVINKDKQ